MRRFDISLLLATAAVVALSTSVSANVGVTSITAGDPLGQPPAQPERVLRVGVDVQANERVTTRATDRAHLVFLDGTALTVGPNSTLVIDKFVYDPDRKLGELSLSTAKGVFRLVGGNISKTNDIKVTTPTASIGIRGGIATFEVAEGGGTRATFLYGERMSVTGQGQTQVATRHGSQISAASGRPPTPPAPVPPGGLAPTGAFERAPANVVAPPAAAPPIQAPVVRAPIPIAPVAPVAVRAPIPTVVQVNNVLDTSKLPTVNSKADPKKLRDQALQNHGNRHNKGGGGGPGGQAGTGKPGGGTAIAGTPRLGPPPILGALKSVNTGNRNVANTTVKVQNNNNSGNNNSGKKN